MALIFGIADPQPYMVKFIPFIQDLPTWLKLKLMQIKVKNRYNGLAIIGISNV